MLSTMAEGCGEGVGVMDAEAAASESEDVPDEPVVTLTVLHADAEPSCDVTSLTSSWVCVIKWDTLAKGVALRTH